LTEPDKLSLQDALRSARETRTLVLGRAVLPHTPRVFQENFPGAGAVVIADATTFFVAGQALDEALTAAGVPCREPFIFTDRPLVAEMGFVAQLEASLRQHDAVPIAVGSGTINDLVKLAAHRTDRPYLCVATAASMDGYTAFGASITCQGAKQTFDCPAPRTVLADIDIIRRAPAAMTASGYADLSAKITAGADWILADALGADPIDPRAWAIVQGGLRAALSDPAGIRAGCDSAFPPLIEGLMLAGLAMQCSRTSRPASGAEHQFSHLWDMERHVHKGEAPSHGFKVGVATIAILRLYEQLLARDLGALDVESCVANWPDPDTVEARVRQRFAASGFVATAVAETRAKHVSRAELRMQLERLRACWPEVRARLGRHLLSAAEMKRRLDLAGAPTEPEQIGISQRRLRNTFSRAYHIRRRFTVLDVAVRTGTLHSLLDGLFGPDEAREPEALSPNPLFA
jgi:glycerol-1-phosphate dehydrogenase [NAD(P)+]